MHRSPEQAHRTRRTPSPARRARGVAHTRPSLPLNRSPIRRHEHSSYSPVRRRPAFGGSARVCAVAGSCFAAARQSPRAQQRPRPGGAVRRREAFLSCERAGCTTRSTASEASRPDRTHDPATARSCGSLHPCSTRAAHTARGGRRVRVHCPGARPSRRIGSPVSFPCSSRRSTCSRRRSACSYSRPAPGFCGPTLPRGRPPADRAGGGHPNRFARPGSAHGPATAHSYGSRHPRSTRAANTAHGGRRALDDAFAGETFGGGSFTCATCAARESSGPRQGTPPDRKARAGQTPARPAGIARPSTTQSRRTGSRRRHRASTTGPSDAAGESGFPGRSHSAPARSFSRSCPASSPTASRCPHTATTGRAGCRRPSPLFGPGNTRGAAAAPSRDSRGTRAARTARGGPRGHAPLVTRGYPRGGTDPTAARIPTTRRPQTGFDSPFASRRSGCY